MFCKVFLLILLLLALRVFGVLSLDGQGKGINVIDGDCPNDPELEMLVKSVGTKTLMYIISYNNASSYIAEKYAACRKSWVKVIRLPLTKYYETAIYFYLDRHRAEWRRYQYVLFATYKSLTPSLLHPSLPVQTFANIKEMLILAQNDVADVYPFVRGSRQLLNSSVAYHGEDFSKAWFSIMNELHISASLLEKCNQMYPFYRNLYMIKPHILERLMTNMGNIFHVTVENQKIKSLVEKDAHYQLGAPRIAQKIFGTPYYQLHPFLFQLFTPCLLKLMGARICIAPLGPCAVNYEYQG